jgi:cobalt transporter subunit CbtA
MTKNLISSAVLAGVAAGLIAALLQFAFVIPTLLEGELYESGARIHFATDGSTQSDKGAPALGGDLTRHVMTVAFNIVTFAGYGLILLAAMVFAAEKGRASLTPRAGLIWGIAGFIAVQLAPAIGLPPELPGTPAAEVAPRQIWWFCTILATAAGLALIAFAKGPIALAGIALILVPHIIGAPHLDTYYGIAPPELSAHFVTLSLGVALAGWSSLGFFCAWFWTRASAD